jgi:hypothetical protein
MRCRPLSMTAIPTEPSTPSSLPSGSLSTSRRPSDRWNRCGPGSARASGYPHAGSGPGSTRESIQLTAFDPPDIPALYLYGEETDAPSFRTPGEVAELFPKAQLRGLAGQRHLAFAFDATSFAEAILAITTAHDR